MSEASDSRRFTLEQARQLLPSIRRVTEAAVRDCEPLIEQLEGRDRGDPEYVRIAGVFQGIVARWSEQVTEFGAEAKGLWLVDFDNGEGYYCWRHPEPTITHFHGYEDGFAGRMKIV
jgi:hypothetical protein